MANDGHWWSLMVRDGHGHWSWIAVNDSEWWLMLRRRRRTIMEVFHLHGVSQSQYICCTATRLKSFHRSMSGDMPHAYPGITGQGAPFCQSKAKNSHVLKLGWFFLKVIYIKQFYPCIVLERSRPPEQWDTNMMFEPWWVFPSLTTTLWWCLPCSSPPFWATIIPWVASGNQGASACSMCACHSWPITFAATK